MLVKVFIKRRIKSGKEMEVFSLLKKLRFNAMNQEGYISGESLVSAEDAQSVMVISTWQSRENWEAWKGDGKRKELDVRLEELQESPTEYESFVFSKYWISAQKGFPEPLD
ncbi:MAG: hypothetical protein GY859_27195 [Desulfobacterales bacterium]|nr:hypothetical protein [Desulfobacterales bacterium]